MKKHNLLLLSASILLTLILVEIALRHFCPSVRYLRVDRPGADGVLLPPGDGGGRR